MPALKFPVKNKNGNKKGRGRDLMYAAAKRQQRPARAVEAVVVQAPRAPRRQPREQYVPRFNVREIGQKLDSTGIGAQIGNAILPGIGGLLGHAAEGLFKVITGQGAYSETAEAPGLTLHSNTIAGVIAPGVQQQVDQMHWNGLATRIAHREFIGTVDMTAGFTSVKYTLSPTDSTVFPWLSTIADKFQKYKLLGSVIEYVPTSANAIASGSPAMGSVSLGVQYDSYLGSPTTLSQMLNWQGSVSGRPSDALMCAVECDGGYTPTNPLYIRHPNDSYNTDKSWYEFAQFVLCLSGTGTAYTGCGQLWITYDMQLIQAYIPDTVPPSLGLPGYEGRTDEKEKDGFVAVKIRR